MAKKAKGKKAKAASTKPKSASRKGTGVRGGGRPRTRQPRQAALIEDARIGPLDKIAAAIGDVRDNMNDLRSEEKGHLQVAKKLMHQYGKSVYKHAGVQVTLVPGDEKVQVRTYKEDTGDASSSGADDQEQERDSDDVAQPDLGETENED